MPKVFLMIETIKWTFYTLFISIMAIIVAVGVGLYLEREIESDDIEFILAKNYVQQKFLDKGKTNSEKLNEIPNILVRNYGLNVNIEGKEEYIVEPRIYESKGLCGIKGSPVVCSDEFSDFYLVDDELKKIEIDLVKKIG